MADWDKGIESISFQGILKEIGAKSARFVKHMQGNGAKATRSTTKFTKLQEELSFAMCKARTSEAYKEKRALLHEENAAVAEWFHSRKDFFATYVFLNKGKPRFGKVTSNAAEQMNNVFLEAHALPILDFVVAIVSWIKEKFVARKAQGLKWKDKGRSITEYARHQEVLTNEIALTHYVEVTYHDELQAQALVSRDITARVTQTVANEVNLEDHSVKCPLCRFGGENGRLCYHAKALLRHLNMSPNDKEWLQPVYHLSTYLEMYDVMLPNLSTHGALAYNNLLPPDSKIPSGRPKKKRYVSTSNKPKKYWACGGLGHMQQTCKNPNTEV